MEQYQAISHSLPYVQYQLQKLSTATGLHNNVSFFSVDFLFDNKL